VSDSEDEKQGDSTTTKDSAPGHEVEDEQPSSESGDEEDAASLDYELRASSRAANRNLFSANTFYIAGDFKSPTGEDRVLVPVADVTKEVADTEPAYVKPDSFEQITKAIDRHRMLALTGRDCGNRLTAGAALRAAGHAPILELPATLSVRELVDSVEKLCVDHRAAGVLVHSLDPSMLKELAGFELRRLRGVLADRAAIVLTVRAELPTSSRPRDLPIITGVAPDSAAVLAKTIEIKGISNEDRNRAIEAFELLPKPVPPGTAVELVELAGNVDGTAADLAARVNGQAPALDKWLHERPTARSVGALAAAAALDGVPRGDFEIAAEELSRGLEGEVEKPKLERRFGPADHALPVDFVSFVQVTIPTHFGPQAAEVVQLRSPHRSDRVTAYLWRHLDAAFHEPYVEWLHGLAASSSGRVIKAAAVTAGVLFIVDPLRIERELLRPWALDGGSRQRYCASLALGVPAATDADPLPARALAKTWSGAKVANLRRAAIFAYGGPLGTWDTGAAAAARLWQIPERNPQLQRAADQALASLAAGGRGAARSRAAVIGLLLGQLESKPVEPRLYSTLPLLVNRLMAGDQTARDSLTGLTDPAERETLEGLANLLARSLDAPAGQKKAMEAIRIVLSAIVDGRASRDFLNQLIAMMRSAADRRQRLPQFETQLERLLKAESRGRGSLRDVARSTHDAFYVKPRGGHLD